MAKSQSANCSDLPNLQLYALASICLASKHLSAGIELSKLLQYAAYKLDTEELEDAEAEIF